MTQENFIEKAKKIHGNKYDYSVLKYNGALKYVEIICPKHGVFKKIATEHIRQRNANHGGCYQCSIKNNHNTEYCIEKFKEIHRNTYDYSLVDYEKDNKKVKIICQKHGVFEQTPAHHKIGQGCLVCGGSKKSTTEEFIEKSNKKHNKKYDYSDVIYSGNKIKVKIKCPKHGIFEQIPNSHLLGQGCPKCSGKLVETKDFILKSNIVHDEKYDYSKVVYKKSVENVIIICPIHGEFKQRPDSHYSGSGCQICSESKGEKKINIFLKKNNINFEKQKIFYDCINPKTGKNLKFDFYIQKYNLLIEYDGEYHFSPWRLYSSKENAVENFEKLKIRDNIKNEYCKKNDILLLRIPYTEFKNIENIITDYLNKTNKL